MSSAAVLGSTRSLTLSANSPNAIVRHPLGSKSGSLAQWGLGRSFSMAGNAAVIASGEQPRVKGESLRLADGDFLEGRMNRVEQVVEFSRDNDTWQGEHCRSHFPHPGITDCLGGRRRRFDPPVGGQTIDRNLLNQRSVELDRKSVVSGKSV